MNDSSQASRLSIALAGRYRIERELGAGGMATVYLAEDLKHDRKVGLKVLKPELTAVLGAERFVVEIKTTAALQHPHILPLFDSGTADGFLYYVMPFIDGETLRSKLDRETQLGIDEAVKIAAAVADALDYAHRHGVIHRDIKPENILLRDGRPMVADFGIALAVSAAAGGRMTETGLSLGTPHYMSPEQATAEKEIRGRSDIYSLGSVLYEMLTGEPPHMGNSAQQIIMKIIAEDAQPVTRLRKSVPPNVAAAVEKSLEKLPADRFDSAKAFADALSDRSFTTAVPGRLGARATNTGRRSVMIGLAAALAGMTLVAGWALMRPPATRPVIRYGLALPLDQSPADGGFAIAASDGSRIVYVGPAARAGVWQLWMKPRDRATAIRLAGTEGVTAAAISPDDAWIAVVQGGVLRKMPIAGGALIPVAEGVANVWGSVAWLDNGTMLYAAREPHRIVSVPEGGGLSTTIWSPNPLTTASNLRPLPGGRGALFAVCPAPCTRSDIWVLDLRTRSARVLVTGSRAAFYVDTRHMVYVRDDQIVMAAPFDLGALEIRGAPVAMMDSVATTFGAYPFFSVSVHGTVVMRVGAAEGRFTLAWVDRAGRETLVDSSWSFRVTRSAGNYGLALSPAGDRLAIGLNTPEGDHIWIKPLPKGPASRVTYGAQPGSRPRWRADGRSVTFVGDSGLYQRRADGTGADSLLFKDSRIDEGLISSDGRWLLFRRGAISSTAGGRDIFGIRLGVDRVPMLLVESKYDEMAIALSPDGRWLAYQSDETGRIEVFVRPFPNTGDEKVQVSSDGGMGPVWARNGRELFYLRSDTMMMGVPVTVGRSLRLGEPNALFRLSEPLTTLEAVYYAPWDVAPDGRFIMARSANMEGRRITRLIIVENWLEELKTKVKR